MSLQLASCSFCSRYDDSVHVICEGRCLICTSCQKSTAIKHLLAKCLDECRGNNDHDVTCPICEQVMAPNMINDVKKYKKDLLSCDNIDGIRAICPQPNIFNSMFPNKSRASKLTKQESSKIQVLSRANSKKLLVDTAESSVSSSSESSSKNMTNSKSAPTLSRQRHHQQEGKQKVSFVKSNKISTAGVMLPPQFTEDSVIDLLQEIFYILWESYIYGSFEGVYPLLKRHFAKNKASKMFVEAKIKFLHDFMTTFPVACLYQKGDGAAAVSRTKSHIVDPMSRPPSPKFNERPTSPKLSSEQPHPAASLPCGNSLAMDHVNASFIYMFGLVLGIYPKIDDAIKPIQGYIATLILTVALCERCVKNNEVISHHTNEGEQPSPGELKAKLSMSIQKPGGSYIPLKRCVLVLKCLLSTDEPRWNMSPLKSACVEYKCDLPWGRSSLSALMHALLLYGNSIFQDDDYHIYVSRTSHSSIRRKKSSNEPFPPINQLRVKLKEIWEHKHDGLQLDITTALQIATRRGTVLSLPYFVCLCVECWELECSSVEADLQRAKLASQRKHDIPISLTYHTNEIMLSERKALMQIYQNSKKSAIDDDEIIPMSCEGTGIDWDDVKADAQLRNLPYLRDTPNLLTRPNGELEGLIIAVMTEVKKFNEWTSALYDISWREEFAWGGLATAPKQQGSSLSSTTARVLKEPPLLKYSVSPSGSELRFMTQTGILIPFDYLENENSNRLRAYSFGRGQQQDDGSFTNNEYSYDQEDSNSLIDLVPFATYDRPFSPGGEILYSQEEDSPGKSLNGDRRPTLHDFIRSNILLPNENSINVLANKSYNFRDPIARRCTSANANRTKYSISIQPSEQNLSVLKKHDKQQRNNSNSNSKNRNSILLSNTLASPQVPVLQPLETSAKRKNTSVLSSPWTSPVPARHSVCITDLLSSKMTSELLVKTNMLTPQQVQPTTDLKPIAESLPPEVKQLEKPTIRNKKGSRSKMLSSNSSHSVLPPQPQDQKVTAEKELRDLIMNTTQFSIHPSLLENRLNMLPLGTTEVDSDSLIFRTLSPMGSHHRSTIDLSHFTSIRESEIPQPSVDSLESLILQNSRMDHRKLEQVLSVLESSGCGRNHDSTQLTSRKFSNLKVINLNGNKIGNQGIHVLCKQIFQNTKLIVDINLQANGISDAGLSTLVDALLDCDAQFSLKRLIMSNNDISLRSETLGIKLSQLDRLKLLDLSWNQISIDCKAQRNNISQLFSLLDNLEVVSLAYNRLGDKGIEIALKAIKTLSSALRLVDFAHCGMTDQMTTFLQKNLNASLKNIDVFLFQGSTMHPKNFTLLAELVASSDPDRRILFDGFYTGINVPIRFNSSSEDVHASLT